MQASKLLVSNLSITEDDYNYKGQFTLSAGGISMAADLDDLDSIIKLEEIKDFFSIDDSVDTLRNELFTMVTEKSGISSRIKDGKDFPGNSKDESAKSLDMA